MKINFENSQGTEALQKQIEKWKRLSASLKKKSFEEPIIIPDMVWITPNGIGKTSLLEYVANELKEANNLIDFYGDVPFFEFYFEYCRPESGFEEMNRLVEEVNNAAGFRNEFHGIIHIDISEWMKKTDEKYFKTFLEYLSDNSDNWLIIISMPESEQEYIPAATAIISSYLRTETLSFSLPSTEAFVNIVKDYLSGYNLKLGEAANAVLTESIDVLRKNKYFDGYKTISMLCKDIVYHIFSEQDISYSALIDINMDYFRHDGEYINKMIYKDNKRNSYKLGF